MVGRWGAEFSNSPSHAKGWRVKRAGVVVFVIAMEHSDRGNLTGLWIASQACNDKEKTQKIKNKKSADYAVNTMCCIK